ncbi:MAG: hypothetical protein IJ091_10320 [Oscillospiraceae bacterium]|nr:hypothetical protein [Oscillospiraceae bacterium]
MKTLKLVLGILCIIFSVFITFQSMLAGLGNALQDNGEVGGSAGILLAVAMLTSGIVMIATRKSTGKGGAIASGVMLLLGGLLGLLLAGSYGDLNIWSGFALIVAAVNLVPLFVKKKN